MRHHWRIRALRIGISLLSSDIALIWQDQARLTTMLIGVVFLFLVGEVPTHLASRRSAVSLLYGNDPSRVHEDFMERWVERHATRWFHIDNVIVALRVTRASRRIDRRASRCSSRGYRIFLKPHLPSSFGLLDFACARLSSTRWRVPWISYFTACWVLASSCTWSACYCRNASPRETMTRDR